MQTEDAAIKVQAIVRGRQVRSQEHGDVAAQGSTEASQPAEAPTQELAAARDQEKSVMKQLKSLSMGLQARSKKLAANRRGASRVATTGRQAAPDSPKSGVTSNWHSPGSNAASPNGVKSARTRSEWMPSLSRPGLTPSKQQQQQVKVDPEAESSVEADSFRSDGSNDHRLEALRRIQESASKANLLAGFAISDPTEKHASVISRGWKHRQERRHAEQDAYDAMCPAWYKALYACVSSMAGSDRASEHSRTDLPSAKRLPAVEAPAAAAALPTSPQLGAGRLARSLPPEAAPSTPDVSESFKRRHPTWPGDAQASASPNALAPSESARGNTWV